MRTPVLALFATSLTFGIVACTKKAASPESGTAQAAAPKSGAVGGAILETMNSGGYTYVKLAAAQGEVWAAVPESQVKVGESVTLVDAVEMHAFASPTLKRTFESIYFGSLAPAPGQGASAAAPTQAPAAPAAAGHDEQATPTAAELGAAHGSAVTAGPQKLDKPVAKASGATGRTVAELFAQKAALKDKPVAVRGKVTKVNLGIMGKNWLHLQDGSGAAAAKDFDLTVTTSGTAAVGDIVLARGTLRADKDFGAGYAYPVILEDSALER